MLEWAGTEQRNRGGKSVQGWYILMGVLSSSVWVGACGRVLVCACLMESASPVWA